MEELNINYGLTKTQRIVYALFGLCLVVSGIYLAVKQNLIGDRGIFFFTGIVYAIIGIITILRSTVWQPAPVLRITNEVVETKKTKMNWTSVSKVNIGLGYIVFLLNGEQKQQKLDFADILYKDVKSVKSKVIEICEQKNIPYHND